MGELGLALLMAMSHIALSLPGRWGGGRSACDSQAALGRGEEFWEAKSKDKATRAWGSRHGFSGRYQPHPKAAARDGQLVVAGRLSRRVLSLSSSACLFQHHLPG